MNEYENIHQNMPDAIIDWACRICVQNSVLQLTIYLSYLQTWSLASATLFCHAYYPPQNNNALVVSTTHGSWHR